MPKLKNVPHEEFAQLIAMGWHQAKAYRDATQTDDKHASWREGCRWRSRKDIAARIDELRREADDAATWTKARLIAFLESVLECPAAGLSEDSPIVESVTETKYGRNLKTFPKAEAARQLTKLCGWESPERKELSLSGSTEIDEALHDLLKVRRN